jgi:hypothetical protein
MSIGNQRKAIYREFSYGRLQVIVSDKLEFGIRMLLDSGHGSECRIVKYSILLACSLLLIGAMDHRASGHAKLKPTQLVKHFKSDQSCVNARDLDRSLAAFSSPELKPELHREILLGYARRSTRCRAQVVGALLRAMDKPDLNLERDQSTFFLWHYGGQVLGALRAAEALDLLIANLGATDGESPNMTHYPAVETVIKIGSISIPKLKTKLEREERPGIRKLAVFCLGSIGGISAKRALLEVLPNEGDKCVNDFIQLTLKSFGNTKRPNHIAADDFVKWFASLFCVEK